MSVSLCIIAKDQVKECKNIFEKYGKYFDEICIAIDNEEAFKELEFLNVKVKVSKYEWINDFSDKRNFLADKSTSEFYFRMDTDDEIENPEIIPELVKVMQDGDFDVFYVPYIYAKDEHGNCIAKHWRETIIRKKDGIYWKKPIHENIFVEVPEESSIIRDNRLKIIHNIDSEHAIQSYKRNFSYLLEEFQKDGENTDPRTIAYLGRMLMAKGHWDKAVLFLENLTKRSGWDDDKYFAWIQMAQCYEQMGKYDIALGCCNEALGLNTKFPDAYLQMGQIYLIKEQYEKAVDWIMPGLVRPEPDTVMVLDPTFYTYKAKINAAMALLGKGDVEMAMKYYQEAKSVAPNEPYITTKEKMFVESFEDDKYIKNIAWLAHYTFDRDKSKVIKLIESMPDKIFRDERAAALKNHFIMPKKWGKKDIVIYCGKAWEEWAPPSVLRGIGGSEEATIYLSKELVKLGYNVTVFNSCGEMGGEYSGVKYIPYYMFNVNDEYENIILWRQNLFNKLNTKNKIIWLHDVPHNGMFTKENIKNIDKVVVLSEYHRSLLPSFVPAEKVFISTNGINIEDFKLNGTIRNPRRAIYTSSYDRGLQHLLEIWPDILKEVPDAELAIFYGWNTYDKMVESGRRSKDFRNYMTSLMNQTGVKEYGRVGHKQLNKEFQKSGIWAYPSHFEEISCISGMKAQANGCIPVCTDYAALKETIKAGIKIEGSTSNGEVKQRFKEEFIKILKDEGRQDVLRQEVLMNRESFDWSLVAKKWSEGLFV